MWYFGIGSLLLAGVVLIQTAQAQETAQPTAHAANAGVARACRAEVPRFCAAADGGPGAGRSAAICLRPYRTSLSLGCRRAVDGALRRGAPG